MLVSGRPPTFHQRGDPAIAADVSRRLWLKERPSDDTSSPPSGRNCWRISMTAPSKWPPPCRKFLSGRGWNCSRKAATLVAVSTAVGACAPLPIESAAGQLQEFGLNCSTHWAREDPLSRQPTNGQHYHIDLSKGLVNYSDPLSAATPIQLAWTSDYEGHTYRITINRMTGSLYEMQFNSSVQRTGYDTSGTCELAPPPGPQPKF